MRILVTGGYGFIGSNFISNIINSPEIQSIVNIDILTYAGKASNLEPNEKLTSLKVNICDESAMEMLLHKHEITHLVHFAAESHVDNSINNPNVFINTNILGTVSLLNAARRYNKLKRFHHVSTDEVFGSLNDTGYFTETTPYNPRSPYSASKAASDHLVNSYFHTYNLPITISNCSNNYGPKQHAEKLIPKIISNIKNNKKVPIYGDGANIRDWLYVDDHCDAIFRILESGVIGESYVIGGNTERTNLQILATICNLMNVDIKDYIEFIDDRKGHDYRYAINYAKITNDLTWTPKVNFIDGLIKTIDFYTK